VTIGALPDNVLLDIFRFCVPQFDPFLYYPPKTWYYLVHVCRRWRSVVLESPLSLDLHLYCTPGTPVREGLDVWPPLPIKIWSGSGPGYPGDNVIAALEHPDRVREIWLFNLHPSLGRLITVMQEPFPALEKLCLEIDDKIGQTVPALANTFLGGFAPCLQSLTLNGIPFPTLPRLLLSSNGLSRLHLCNIPHSGYISPEALARAVSILTQIPGFLPRSEDPTSTSTDTGCPPRSHDVQVPWRQRVLGRPRGPNRRSFIRRC
jgi:F-box-like